MSNIEKKNIWTFKCQRRTIERTKRIRQENIIGTVSEQTCILLKSLRIRRNSDNVRLTRTIFSAAVDISRDSVSWTFQTYRILISILFDKIVQEKKHVETKNKWNSEWITAFICIKNPTIFTLPLNWNFFNFYFSNKVSTETKRLPNCHNHLIYVIMSIKNVERVLQVCVCVCICDEKTTCVRSYFFLLFPSQNSIDKHISEHTLDILIFKFQEKKKTKKMNIILPHYTLRNVQIVWNWHVHWCGGCVLNGCLQCFFLFFSSSLRLLKFLLPELWTMCQN